MSSATQGQIDITVGYIDPVIGVTSWPATTTAWLVLPALPGAAGAQLAVTLSLQPSAFIATATAAGGAATTLAAELAGRYATIWYQLMQPDMQATLATTLQQSATAAPQELPLALAPLRYHAAACYAFAVSAARFTPALVALPPTATLVDALEHYGCDWQALGLAAQERPLGELMVLPQGGVDIPQFALFQAGDTVATALPGVADPVAVLSAKANLALPLRVGVELVVPAVQRAVTQPEMPLRLLAAAWGLRLESLVAANAAGTALLRPGFIFSALGVEVEIPPLGEPGCDASLNEVAALFRANGVPFDAVMAAGANADQPGMFRPEAQLWVDRRLTQEGWSLAESGTGVTASVLAQLNSTTPDLFPAGTALLLGVTRTDGLAEVPLAEVARTYAIEPGELLRYNSALRPRALPVAGLAAWPAQPAELRLPYRIRAGESMTEIANRLLPAGPDPALALVMANRAMPGSVVGGRTISVAGQSLTTQSGDSFDVVLARANPPLSIEQFASAIADDGNILAPAALLLCPPAQLPQQAQGVTLLELVERYGLQPGNLLSANLATPNLLCPGVEVTVVSGGERYTQETAAADSLNALLRRFVVSGVEASVNELVRDNAKVPLFAPEALLLLPPAETQLNVAIGVDGWQWPAVIFPLQCWLTLARAAQLVDPGLRGSEADPSPVVAARSLLTADGMTDPTDSAGSAQGLALFAATLEQAIAGLKLATGGPSSANGELWGVSFLASGGIAQVTIAPDSVLPGVTGAQPLSFALRPLSTSLEARYAVSVAPFDMATGQWGEGQLWNFQGIDLEVWARSWLAGLDLIATAPYAEPAYRVAPAALAQLLAAKEQLAEAIADGLSAILQPQAQGAGAIGGGAWQVARAALLQRLLRQLVPAYDTSALLQFSAQIEAPDACANARLVGSGQLLDPLTGEVADDQLVRLSSAKTPLKTAAAAPVSFSLDLSHLCAERAVALRPSYVVNQLEFAITLEEDEYESSHWLSFARPFDLYPPATFSADLGRPVVPLPLRAYPDPPVLVGHRARVATAPASVAEALLWGYEFAYTHAGAAQDEIRIELEFNRHHAPQLRTQIADRLFPALAQYASASDPLWQILERLQAPEASADDSVLVAALGSYASLATEVAEGWQEWWAAGLAAAAGEGIVPASRQIPVEGTAHHQFHHYLARLHSHTAEGVAICQSLTLQRLGTGGGLAWPEIVAVREDGTEVALSAGSIEGQRRNYDFPSTGPLLPAASRITLRYTFGGLSIADYQNASAGVAVIRNARLLGPEGPESAPDFIYRTPQLSFPEPLVPLINIDERIDIGPWSSDPQENPLNGVFTALFGSDTTDRQIAFAIRYGYRLVAAGPDSIETLLPVLLHPRYTYVASGSDATVPAIITALDHWQSETQPSSNGALWGFGIDLYSNTDPSLERPLLRLKRLVSPLS